MSNETLEDKPYEWEHPTGRLQPACSTQETETPSDLAEVLEFQNLMDQKLHPEHYASPALKPTAIATKTG